MTSTLHPRPRRPGAGTRVLFVLASAALASATGCEREGGWYGYADLSVPAGWTTAVDTLPGGGLHVVHTPPDDASPTWTLEPELRIGAMDGTGPDVFGEIRSMAVGPDGRIAVLDGQAQEVRIFGPDGAHLRTFGRKGGGPGEFEGANGVAWGPDGRIRVTDSGNTRLSFLDPDSGFVGSHRYEPLMIRFPWGGLVDDRGRTWSPFYRMGDAPGEGRSLWVGLDTAGVAVDSVVPYEEAPLDQPGAGGWNVPMGERRLTMGVPNYPSGEAVLDPGLRLWTTRRGDPSYRLVRWTADGDTALLLEVRRPPVPTDRARVDSMVSGWEERFGVTLDRSKIPDTAPAIRGVFFDDDGRLWIRPATPPGDDRVLLDAFDTETGAYLGTLSTGLGLQTVPPPVIRGDAVWGVVRDELDVPGVVRAQVIPAEGAYGEGQR